ncbi:cytochrome P450 [Hyaloscypha finlandica]|nr:cytochrome P450 [Hyaloscypha finlandica]
MLLMPHSDRWRNQRKIMHSILNNRQVETKFIAYQELESKQLVYDYLTDPRNFHLANQRFSNFVIIRLVFGRRAAIDDPGHKAILESVAVLISVQPAEEYLRYVPMTVQPSKTSAVAETCWGGILQEDSCAGVWHTGEYQMKPLWLPSSLYTGEYDRLVKNMENGSARPCFAVETEKLFVFSTLLEAGSDTSRNAIAQAVAAMAAYPGWVIEARAMLDEVCGVDAERLPSLSDRERLPYITVAAKECLRWRPFIQTGAPHMLAPVCVGYSVGANNIWIAIARLIYCFDITEDPASTNWEIHKEALFKVKISPRSQAHIELINRIGTEALAADYWVELKCWKRR